MNLESMGPPDRMVVWESLKFDGSPHRSALAADLGSTRPGRWLFVRAGTRVLRPDGRGYDHPCDALTLIPIGELWTATWLRDWEPSLYVDVARLVHARPDRVITVDLDLDVVRHRDGTVEVLDAHEFRRHRSRFGYPDELVAAARSTVEALTAALEEHQEPFGSLPRPPILPDGTALAGTHPWA